MRQFLCTVILTCLIVFSLARKTQSPAPGLLKEYTRAMKQYRAAERLAEKAGDNEMLMVQADRQLAHSLRAFKDLAILANQAGYDSLLFFVLVQAGYIENYLGRNDEARNDYLHAISIKKKLPGLEDSLLFRPYLFTGGFYYNSHDYDSALYYYQQALGLLEKYQRDLDESQRLYNRLGVMYYETGNYRKAKNYIEKALAIQLSNDNDPAFVANYQLNLASLLVKLEDLDSARLLYEQLLKGKYFKNEILHNLSIISLKKKDPAKALGYLRQINYGNDRKNLDLFYNYAMSFAGIGDKDSAEYYIHKAKQENEKWNRGRQNTAFGLLLKFEADELSKEGLYKAAVLKYQQALMQFDPEFSKSDPATNPRDFTAVYSYINLFQTLAAKGETLVAAYRQEKQERLLLQALTTYQSAYALADHVEKTYDSDESRLFLNRLKYTVHSRPIDLCIELYELTREPSYLEEAYLFDQRNKASVLAFHIQEMELKSKGKLPEDLLARESKLRTAITRFSLQALQSTDSLRLAFLNDTIRDMSIELGRIQEKISTSPFWQQTGSFHAVPPTPEISAILDKKTALLSYHLSENSLITICITRGGLTYHRDTISGYFTSQVNTYKNQLHLATGNGSPNSSISRYLYDKLISPLKDKIGKAERLIIIPDDELNYLPFESLQDNGNRYLVEKFSVQYQYSTALLVTGDKGRPQADGLAFAPFTLRDASDSTGNYLQLPASGEEVSNLEGTVFFDTAATKQAFLKHAGSHGIIHLATHAKVSNEDPSASFIAFYPGSDHRLYSAEIANLDLSKTSLVILSACETGMGPLVKGEGLLSLSRAFAYAGCNNIITSLWKAEDKSTAFLSQRLHFYLNNNYSRDRALQMAKRDLLNSTGIDPRLKSPAFWSHLVFIGHYEPEGQSLPWFWMVIGMLVSAAIILLVRFNKKNRQVHLAGFSKDSANLKRR